MVVLSETRWIILANCLLEMHIKLKNIKYKGE